VPLIRRALIAVAGLYVLAFVACAAVRLTFGFELTWVESGMQAMTARLAAHQSIYAAPSPSYVPFLYPPLYYVAAHGVDAMLPRVGGLAAMRLVSLLATLATVAAVARVLGRRRGLDPTLRWLLPALYLAFYGRFDYWLDASRVDSLFVLLQFAAAALLVEGSRMPSALLAGLLAGLAILTKQPALPLFAGACVLAAAVARQPGRALAAAVAAAAVVVAVLAALGELSNPWLTFYTVDVPATHPLLLLNLGRGVAFVLVAMPLLVLAAAHELRAPARRGAASVEGIWAMLFALWAVVLLALRMKEGAHVNFFMPLVPVGLVVLATARLGPRHAPLLLGQFLILAYNPIAAVPVAQDWSAAFQLVNELRAIPGDVYLPQFPGYLAMAGKRPVAHDLAVCDLQAIRPDVLEAIDADLRGGAFAAAVTWPDAAARKARCHLDFPSAHYGAGRPLPTGGAFFRGEYAPWLGGIRAYAGEADIFIDPKVGRRETEEEDHGRGGERARFREAEGGG
jgi:hypothetical protein